MNSQNVNLLVNIMINKYALWYLIIHTYTQQLNQRPAYIPILFELKYQKNMFDYI